MTTTSPNTELLPITVIVHEDTDDVTIEWDETHPLSISLGLDSWTEEQWLDAMENGMEELVQAHEAEQLNA